MPTAKSATSIGMWRQVTVVVLLVLGLAGATQLRRAVMTVISGLARSTEFQGHAMNDVVGQIRQWRCIEGTCKPEQK